MVRAQVISAAAVLAATMLLWSSWRWTPMTTWTASRRPRPMSAWATTAEQRQTQVAESSSSLSSAAAMANVSLIALTDVLVYNAYPKSGSSTVSELLSRRAKSSGFKFEFIGGWGNQFGSKGLSRQYQQAAQVKFVQHILSQKRPYGMRQHVHFVDFAQLGADEVPTYINFLRDPIERFSSNYHFARGGDNLAKLYYNHLCPTTEPQVVEGVSFTEWRNKSINTCVMNITDRECNPLPGDQVDLSIPYFCGQHRHCVQYGNRQALADAITNLDRHYSVVGILEHLQDSYSVLESRLPKFFNNTKAFLGVHRNRNMDKRRPKEPLGEETRARLAQVLADEYELYDFARRRLMRQAKEADEALEQQGTLLA